MKESTQTRSSGITDVLITLIPFSFGAFVIFFESIDSLITTKIWNFEFPVIPLSMLLMMVGALIAGIIWEVIYSRRQIRSKILKSLAVIGLIFNSALFLLLGLHLISSFLPRTMTRTIDYKTEMGGYICVKEIGTDNQWSEKINFNKTLIYVQPKNKNQQKRLTSVDTLEVGQVVKIKYIDLSRSAIWGIYPTNITILEGQYQQYSNENCGNFLESI